MKRYNAQADRVNLGNFSDLFIIGTTRGANGASDFTDADLSQDFTLLTPAAGDQLIYPLALAATKIAFVGTALTTVTLDVGQGIGGAHALAGGAMVLGNASAAAPGGAGTGGPVAFNGTNTLSARVATVGANLSALTAGEIWIWVALFRLSERMAIVA